MWLSFAANSCGTIQHSGPDVAVVYVWGTKDSGLDAMLYGPRRPYLVLHPSQQSLSGLVHSNGTCVRDSADCGTADKRCGDRATIEPFHCLQSFMANKNPKQPCVILLIDSTCPESSNTIQQAERAKVDGVF